MKCPICNDNNTETSSIEPRKNGGNDHICHCLNCGGDWIWHAPPTAITASQYIGGFYNLDYGLICLHNGIEITGAAGPEMIGGETIILFDNDNNMYEVSPDTVLTCQPRKVNVA
jgi:hypothetical protein